MARAKPERSPYLADAAAVLVRIDPDVGGTVGLKYLEKMLAGPSEDAEEALRAAAKLGPLAVPLMPAITKQLRVGTAPRRMQAAIVLGAMGPDGRDAVLLLRIALKDSDPQVRRAAAEALKQLEK